MLLIEASNNQNLEENSAKILTSETFGQLGNFNDFSFIQSVFRCFYTRSYYTI